MQKIKWTHLKQQKIYKLDEKSNQNTQKNSVQKILSKTCVHIPRYFNSEN